MDLLGDLEFPDRFGDLESALRGDLEFPDRLGDLEALPAGDLDLFEAGDASLAFRAGDRSLDLITKKINFVPTRYMNTCTPILSKKMIITAHTTPLLLSKSRTFYESSLKLIPRIASPPWRA